MSRSPFVIIQTALVNAPTSCRYHGTDFDIDEWTGEPRCETCRQPYRVGRALDALDELIRAAAEREAGRS